MKLIARTVPPSVKIDVQLANSARRRNNAPLRLVLRTLAREGLLAAAGLLPVTYLCGLHVLRTGASRTV